MLSGSFTDKHDFKEKVEKDLVKIIKDFRAAQRADLKSKKAASKKAVDSATTEEPERLDDESDKLERHAEGRNPYRELSYYDVDNDYFYGRRDFVDRVIRRFETQLADPNCTAACRITGTSGAESLLCLGPESCENWESGVANIDGLCSGDSSRIEQA